MIGVTVASSVFADALLKSSCFGVTIDVAGFGNLVFTGATGADVTGFVNAGAAELGDGDIAGAYLLSKNECAAAMTSGV